MRSVTLDRLKVCHAVARGPWVSRIAVPRDLPPNFLREAHVAAMDRLADLAAIEAGLVMPITRIAGVTGVRAACACPDAVDLPKLQAEIRRLRAAEFRARALALEAGGGIVAVLRAQALRCKAAVLDMGGWAC